VAVFLRPGRDLPSWREHAVVCICRPGYELGICRGTWRAPVFLVGLPTGDDPAYIVASADAMIVVPATFSTINKWAAGSATRWPSA